MTPLLLTLRLLQLFITGQVDTGRIDDVGKPYPFGEGSQGYPYPDLLTGGSLADNVTGFFFQGRRAHAARRHFADFAGPVLLLCGLSGTGLLRVASLGKVSLRPNVGNSLLPRYYSLLLPTTPYYYLTGRVVSLLPGWKASHRGRRLADEGTSSAAAASATQASK